LDCPRVQSILNNDRHIQSIFQFLHIVVVMLEAMAVVEADVMMAEVYKSHTIR
jgi:hypothetical protein